LERRGILFRKRLRDFLINGFAAYGLLWTIVESGSAFFPQIKPDGLTQYLFLILPSVEIINEAELESLNAFLTSGKSIINIG
jgi:hypothetical protein